MTTAMLLPAASHLHPLSIHDGEKRRARKHGRTIRLPSEEEEEEDDGVLPLPSPTIETLKDDSMTTTSPSITVSKTYGGIRNLGNTCYFNSALQLLASLDFFTQAMKMNEPKFSSEDELVLRKEFLSVMEALARGETVQPDSFKKALDARSPLFLGFRQQDSHEFLITLLELLDEDYQKKPEVKVLDDDKHDELMDVDHHDENKTGPLEDLPEDGMATIEVHTSPLQLPRCLSELDVDDITELLNGSPTQPLDLEKPSTKTTDNFKLIGGRINNTCTGVMQWLGAGIVLPEDEDTSVSSTASNEIMEDVTNAPNVDDHEHEDVVNNTKPTFSSPVDDYFTTQVRAQLTCDSCKYTRTHMATYRHLSLEIGADGGSIEEGIRKLFSPETRDIKCEKCFCETATQTTEIVRLPRALLLHFKRFIVDFSPDFKSATYRKNNASIKFEETLKIRGEDSVIEDCLGSDVSFPEPLWGTTSFQQQQQQSSTPPEYRVRGVVNHHGASASCGHYNADAHKLYWDGQREWTRLNDSMVSKITAKQALSDSSRTAYMVVYELVPSSLPSSTC